jgi:adenylylsulfate kinase
MTEKTHIVWHDQAVSRDQREQSAGHKSCVVWFTGLSGSGKSTIANLVDQQLYERKVRSYLLDGDNVRHGINASSELLKAPYGDEFAARFGLGFSAQDREENIRRIGQVSRLFCDAGLIALTAFVSPYRRDRDAVRASLDEGDFVEVFVDAPLAICEARDPKGLYKKARAGEIRSFTGIDDPYEAPANPELVLDSGHKDAVTLAGEVIAYLQRAAKIS